MYVLHAHWQPPPSAADSGGLFFWTEVGGYPEEAVAEGHAAATIGRARARDHTSRAHPYTASPEDVRSVLRALGYTRTASSAVITLLLPGTKAGPLPSPEANGKRTASGHSVPQLLPWSIPVVQVAPADGLSLLAGLPRPGEMPQSARVVLGADARYWQKVSGLVLETLAQHKFVPASVTVHATGRGKGEALFARWLPVLDGPNDAARIERLVRAMPPVCRTAGTPEAIRSPREVLDSFISAMVNAAARDWGQAGRPAQGQGSDPADRWLEALFGDGAVPMTAAQALVLRRALDAWLRNLHVAGAGDFRIAFRLAPPQAAEGQDHAWRLHYMVQARYDPSLLVPAEEIWEGRGEVLAQLGRRLDKPQERLLGALGYASRLYPPLARSLTSRRPTELDMSAEEAFSFLREAAPLLEQSGFGVLVPPWWNKRGARLGVKLRVRPRRGAEASQGRMNFQDLVSYRWELSVGDTALTEPEFRALVALKSPLVQIRGQWVQLDPEQIAAAMRFWNSRDWEGEASLLEALQMGLGAETGLVGDTVVEELPVEDVSFEGWLDDWLKQMTSQEKLEELPHPTGFNGALRPYQRYGFSWLAFLRRWGLGACLADDMGLGKTAQTLALLLHDEERGQAGGAVLLICPTSVVGNWRKEVERFAPSLSVYVHQGFERLRDQEFLEQAQQHDIVVTSYALARRDAEMLQGVNWRGVVLDEAQNIKNPVAKQTQAIRRLPAGFRIALTGTPVENRLSELWSIMHFLNPGYLGSREAFRKNFSIPVERYGDEAATKRLRTIVSPFILRRVKTDPRVIQDLPDKLEMKVYTNLTEEQATLYEVTVQESLRQVEEAEGINRRGLVLSMLMKLKQVCNHPALFLHQANLNVNVGGSHKEGDGGGAPATHELAGRSGKLDRLTEMLEEVVSVGDQALVFTQFAEMGHILQAHLRSTLGCPVLYLHGGTPGPQRDQMVDRFQASGGPPIFVLSLKAGGTGLNLMRANHVFHFDRWWNPAVEDQATDRAFRIGQVRNVQVHKFVSIGTMEEMIDDLIEGKRALAQAVVGSGENWLTELSTEELKKLVMLKRE